MSRRSSTDGELSAHSDAEGGEKQQEEGLMWPFRAFGGPGDVLEPRGEVCREINEILGRAIARPPLCFGGDTDALPNLPGLSVEGVGTVPLPLCEEVAMKLMKRGVEDRESVWVIAPDLVEIKNQAWNAGIQLLGKLSAENLGFNGIELQPVLSRMVLFAPGGRAEGLPNAEDERAVATLVLQLPSECTGGDLVVFEGRTGKCFRFQLGKQDGAAALKPHVVAYSVDGSCSVEEVTNGYYIHLEYSLCLPLDAPWLPGKCVSDMLTTRLADAVKRLKGGPEDALHLEFSARCSDAGEDENNMLALLLSKACSQAKVVKGVCETLSGVDKDLFDILRNASTVLSHGKRLKIYVTHLQSGRALGQEEPMELATWYTVEGQKIADAMQLTKRMNFLNPTKEKLSELWETGEGNAWWGQERFALVMWPVSADIWYTMACMGEHGVLSVLPTHNSISGITLRWLFNDLQLARNLTSANQQEQLFNVCQALVPMVLRSGDVGLAKSLLSQYVALLKDVKKVEFFQYLSRLVRAFGWSELNVLVLKLMDFQSHETSVRRALDLIKLFDDEPTVKTDLVIFALKRALGWCISGESSFAASGVILNIFRHVKGCDGAQVYPALSQLLESMNGKDVGPVVEVLSCCVETTMLPEYRVLLANIVGKRLGWLNAEIKGIKTPFTWKLVATDFPDAAGIATFLRSTKASLVIRGYKNFAIAQARVELLRQKIKGSIRITANGQREAAYVRILKTGGEFDTRRKDLNKYEVEVHLNRLLQALKVGQEIGDGESTNIGEKRRRLDQSMG